MTQKILVGLLPVLNVSMLLLAMEIAQSPLPEETKLKTHGKSFLMHYYQVQADESLERLEVSLFQPLTQYADETSRKKYEIVHKTLEQKYRRVYGDTTPGCYFGQISFNMDGTQLMGGDESSIFTFNVDDLSLKNYWDKPITVKFRDFAMSPDETHIAVLAADRISVLPQNQFYIFDRATRKRKIITVDKPIETIKYTADGKIFMTLKENHSLVYLYNPENDTVEEIHLNFTKELKDCSFTIVYSEDCMLSIKQSIENLVTSLNILYKSNQQAFENVDKIFVTDLGLPVIFMVKGKLYKLVENRLVLFKTKTNNAVVVMRGKTLIIGDDFKSRGEAVDDQRRRTEVWNIDYEKPMLTLENAGCIGALSRNNIWVAVKTRELKSDESDGYLAPWWDERKIGLYKIDFLTDGGINSLLSGQITFKQRLFIKFHNDLEDKYIQLEDLSSLKHDNSFTPDGIQKELKSVFDSFNPSIRAYLKIRYADVI